MINPLRHCYPHNRNLRYITFSCQRPLFAKQLRLCHQLPMQNCNNQKKPKRQMAICISSLCSCIISIATIQNRIETSTFKDLLVFWGFLSDEIFCRLHSGIFPCDWKVMSQLPLFFQSSEIVIKRL